MECKGSLYEIHYRVAECPMKKIIPILLVIVILASGCLQPHVENQENLATYKHPDSGFTMKYPESWNVSDRSLDYHLQNFSRILFSSPDNQAAFTVDIKLSHHPEGEELGGVGLSYECPNSTGIMFSNNTQIGGLTGTQWMFLIKNPDREFYDNLIVITQICPELKNTRIDYAFWYNYTAGDPPLEETIYAILNSIEFPCPSKK